MRRLLALVVALVSLLGATWQAVSVELIGTDRVDRRGARPNVSTQGERFVIGAAGDIACPSDPRGDDAPSVCQYDDTADLLEDTGLDRVLPLGDNQYDNGEYANYVDYFDPTWAGRSRTSRRSPATTSTATTRARGHAATSGTSATPSGDRTGSATTRTTSARARRTRAGT
jgi:hypothetical protein